MPSATSTMTTVRASSFSATRWAVVAPTFPAPTTVILLTMSAISEGELPTIQKYRARTSMLSPDLGQRAQPADASREERVCLRLLRERTADERLERNAGAQRRAQIHLVVAEQAGAQAAVRRESHPIAAAAVGMRHRGDHADATEPIRKAMVRRGTVAARRTRNRLQRPERSRHAREHFVARHHMV